MKRHGFILLLAVTSCSGLRQEALLSCRDSSCCNLAIDDAMKAIRNGNVDVDEGIQGDAQIAVLLAAKADGANLNFLHRMKSVNGNGVELVTYDETDRLTPFTHFVYSLDGEAPELIRNYTTNPAY